MNIFNSEYFSGLSWHSYLAVGSIKLYICIFCIFRIQISDVYLAAGGSILLYRRRYQISQTRLTLGSNIFLFYQKSRIKHFLLWSISYEREQQCRKEQLRKVKIWNAKSSRNLMTKFPDYLGIFPNNGPALLGTP